MDVVAMGSVPNGLKHANCGKRFTRGVTGHLCDHPCDHFCNRFCNNKVATVFAAQKSKTPLQFEPCPPTRSA